MKHLNTTLPGWAKWIAQDADGSWWAYEVEPLQHHKGWYENEIGRVSKIISVQEQENWRKTLKRL
jgi:poly(3-hydroxyalkanoate) synthetase